MLIQRSDSGPIPLPVPCQDRWLSFKCRSGHSYGIEYLRKVLRIMKARGEENILYPDKFTEFEYTSSSNNWIYPILPDDRIYMDGEFETDFMVFNEKAIILGGVSVEIIDNSPQFRTCILSSETNIQAAGKIIIPSYNRQKLEHGIDTGDLAPHKLHRHTFSTQISSKECSSIQNCLSGARKNSSKRFRMCNLKRRAKENAKLAS
ncbi:BgtE-20087 [Blumeria graminis f. sp. tritici]|uniref:BgtE-20087 n=3 Tax=Blumeria graminis TaxID=34373 RepID=A0A9X9LB12_BLUGR|nr:BgtE-20087 [Blumeria graminis f. sp. tritici]